MGSRSLLLGGLIAQDLNALPVADGHHRPLCYPVLDRCTTLKWHLSTMTKHTLQIKLHLPLTRRLALHTLCNAGRLSDSS